MTAHAAIKNTFFEDFFVQKSLTIIAFIDYFGLEHLSNKQKGHDDERGMRWTDDLNNELSAKPFEDYDPKKPTKCPKFILIKINDYSINLKNGDLYEAVRASWRINPDIANKYPYVLAVRYGIVVGVYQINEKGWKKTADGKRAILFSITAAFQNSTTQIHG